MHDYIVSKFLIIIFYFHYFQTSFLLNFLKFLYYLLYLKQTKNPSTFLSLYRLSYFFYFQLLQVFLQIIYLELFVVGYFYFNLQEYLELLVEIVQLQVNWIVLQFYVVLLLARFQFKLLVINDFIINQSHHHKTVAFLFLYLH